MNEYDWDIFIAHAGPDKDFAECLYELLADSCRVFLDSRSLKLGDDFDQELSLAQDRSFITVVLVSGNTNRAFYQREEIARAIDLARADPQSHRVIPLYLGAMSYDVPYGLRLKHGMHVEDIDGLQTAARRLLELLGVLEPSGDSILSPESNPPSAPKISVDEVLAEIKQKEDEELQTQLKKANELLAKGREYIERAKQTRSGKTEDSQ